MKNRKMRERSAEGEAGDVLADVVNAPFSSRHIHSYEFYYCYFFAFMLYVHISYAGVPGMASGVWGKHIPCVGILFGSGGEVINRLG